VNLHKCFRVGAIVAVLSVVPAVQAQGLDGLQRERAQEMLHDLANGMRKNYYDPKFHGIDMDARYKAAEEKIKRANRLGDALMVIAATLEPLNDSHSFFLPPSRPFDLDYGYFEEMVGDRCFITALKPGSDAAAKLHLGDQVVSYQGFTPTRDTLWKMNYSFQGLMALPVLQMKVRSPDGSERDVQVAAKVIPRKLMTDLTKSEDIFDLIRQGENRGRLLRQRSVEYDDGLMIWKMPQFTMREDEIDHMMQRARKYKSLVLDLRGNPGGLVSNLTHLVGLVMDHDVTIATRMGRKEKMDPMVAKSAKGNAYSGSLIVLIDSKSASAAELFARVIQLEHRGTVLGDQSSGSVMESKRFPYSTGADVKIFYGASITDADLIMADGKSLEHNGVVPDEKILPSPTDLLQDNDPVLAKAAELGGVRIDASKAGSLFPVEWER
jgi:hypothetical protein